MSPRGNATCHGDSPRARRFSSALSRSCARDRRNAGLLSHICSQSRALLCFASVRGCAPGARKVNARAGIQSLEKSGLSVHPFRITNVKLCFQKVQKNLSQKSASGQNWSSFQNKSIAFSSARSDIWTFMDPNEHLSSEIRILFVSKLFHMHESRHLPVDLGKRWCRNH